MTIRLRPSPKDRPTKGTITGDTRPGYRARRRSALLTRAALIAVPLMVLLAALRTLPSRSGTMAPESQVLRVQTSPAMRDEGQRFPEPQIRSAEFDSEEPPGEAPVGTQRADANSPEQPATPESNRVAELAAFFSAASHPQDRAALANELAAINSPIAVRELLKLLDTETNPLTRRDILYALATAEARHEAAPDLTASLQALHKASDNYEERGLMHEVLSEAPTAESVRFLRRQANRSEADPYEQLSASEALMRISATAPELLAEDEVQVLQTRLRIEAQAAESEPEYQSQALMALGGRKEENQAFFQQMLGSTRDGNVRHLLSKLAQ